ncbi:IS66 family insertion sequence element accessory protein TnpB [Hoeflea sp.]|uniref:IS66 family insertion sequence element accessory protein TnpB n=1 Tax=Hoeflea sp. TaxID=1940281 RepID=UPI0025C294C9|nr:IS66 family insertion sequence element accessory protein TnpB [Hoeflea sp.]
MRTRLRGFCQWWTGNDRISGGREGVDRGWCHRHAPRHEHAGIAGASQGLGRDPHAGEIYCFRGRRGDLVKILWHDGVGMSLYLKRLEAGKFIWPVSQSGEAVQICAAQPGYLLEGIDWRNPRWTQRPAEVG